VSELLPDGTFTWTAAGAWGSFLVLLGIIARQVGPWRKISVDAEKSFRDDLVRRVERLEDTLERERQAAQHKEKQLRDKHEVERRIDRHRINNLSAAFNSFITLLKQGVPVDKAIEAVEKMRLNHLELEATEAATLRASLIDGSNV
jgi:hypothetical protein